ncbi:MAG TPA: zinc-dependent metalloprotease [Chitinophagales bacterium]|nr:zinc-dependent metalloprotease [Chitinophagales bacterium]
MKSPKQGLILITAVLFMTANMYAKKEKKKKEDDTVAVKTMTDSVKTPPKDTISKKDNKPQFKTIKEVTEKCRKYSGLFNVYQDTTTGKTYLEISEDKIGKEYIYFAYVLDGVLDAGYARGGYKDNSVFTIQRYFDRIDFVLQNTSYYFDKNNELSKAENANINQPLFLSEKIAALSTDDKTKKRTYLIDADNLFLGENITQIKPSKSPSDKSDAFSMGSLSSKKSKYIAVKDYPQNTDVSVEYIYENPLPVNTGTDEVTDARFISVKMQHSLIEVPQNKFKPRYDDPRVGYFIEKITDQTSTNAVPWKDLIHRWNLEKKNPNDKLSEPVKPITWWIEKTTPKEFRPIIRNAVLAWNEAFESAGFKNAVECFEQPDTASWEAEDIRYNVIRWTSSPRPPYGGYGPSFVNPRTGEIIGADIMLEFVYLTNRLPLEKLYEIAALDNLQPATDLNYENCVFGEGMHQNILYGTQLLNAYGFSDMDKDEFIKQALYDLVLHEVGHTFGLMHNFTASQLHSIEQMQDPVLGATVGLTASVMDYTIPNISTDKTKQGLYFDIKPGPYDKWAIQYGYINIEDEAEEKAALQKILSESVKKEHRFKNDADDMRSVGKGIDPSANIYDMSNDAIGYALGNIKMVNEALPKLLTKYSTQDKSYHELRNAYLILSGHYARSLNVIDRYIGGVYVNRNFVGQDTSGKPFTVVPLSEQKRAMQAISKYAFSKSAFNVPNEIYAYLQMQRRGYDFRKESEDPKIHDRVLNIQRAVLDQLLHNTVMQRLTDSKYYGNKYSVNAMLKDVTNGIFMEDLGASVSTIRQNLQEEYVGRLLNIIDTKSSYSYTSKSAAFGEVQRILSWMETPYGSDASTQAHRAHLAYIINNALDLKK